MLKESTITQVRQADIAQVIGSYIKLDRNNKACCPFHDERTASFSVNNKKGIYKCFGCGAGGDVIRFVMDYDHLDFIAAIEKIAAICKIEVEYEKVNKEEVKKQRDEIAESQAVLNYAIKKYREILWSDKQSTAWQYITSERGLSEEALTRWQIGYAPDEWRTLTQHLIQDGKYKPSSDIGIVKTSNGQNYDAYRNRITIPIKNERGEYIGIGGRALPTLPPSGGDGGGPKYLNSPESALYHKSRVLFGLYEAEKSIRTQKKVILVEGYLDVISLHEAGFENTVATCGTALTHDQVKLIQRYTDHVIILRDGDEAGRKAIQKDVPILLQHGLKISVIILEDGEDPDSLVHKNKSFLEDFMKEPEDAVMWLATEWIGAAGEDVYNASEATLSVLRLLANIENSVLRNKYLEKICKSNRWKLTDLRHQLEEVLKEKVEEENEEDENDPYKNLPENVDRNDVIKYGFFERTDKYKTGYYFLNGSGGDGHQLTNFILKPLFHIYSPTDNRRMIAVNNGYVERILEMPSDKMLSVEFVCGTLFKEGNFVPRDGFAKGHLYKILNKIGDKFPICYEIKKLGWQPEGFFAFNNYIYKPADHDNDGINNASATSPLQGGQRGVGALEAYDEYGIAKIGDQRFLSPSIGKANDLIRNDESIFENDKYLTFKESPVNFEQWADLMVRTYDQNAWMAIPFAVATIMRDIIRQITKIPHLYLYGQVGSGKSEFGESVSYLFFSGKGTDGELYKPMNLNQGTDYAFFNRMERFINVPNALNEFDENAIPDEWFRAIKSAYDGEGREKGRKERDRATVQKINCTLILMGQYLGTKDDNSVLSRSLPLPIRKVDDRPEVQVKDFNRLKELEKQGLSGILTEMMDWRPIFKKNFAEAFYKISRLMQDEVTTESVPNRIVKNMACMMTVVHLVNEKIKLPFTDKEFFQYAREFMNNMAALIVKTSGISEFWSMMEYLLDRALIVDGFDFFIEARNHVILRPSRTEEIRKDFPAPRKLLFIRLSNIHKLYRENSRKTGNDAGLNESTLVLYMKEQPYYIGQAKSERFTTPEGKQIKTSCIVVDYEKLDINLERTILESPEDRIKETIIGEVIRNAEETSKRGIFKFTLAHLRQKETADGPFTENVYTTCFTSDPIVQWEAQKEKKLQVTGMVSVHKNGNYEKRTMDITSWKNELQMKEAGKKEVEPF